MKIGWTLLAVGALLFVVSAIAGDDSQISDIAKMDKSDIRRSAAEVANMGGFSEESELGLLAKEAESDRSDETKRKPSGVERQQSASPDSAGRSKASDPAIPRAETNSVATTRTEPVRRADVPAPDWDIPDNTPAKAAIPSPPRYAASRTGAFKVEKLKAPKSPGED